ncbi:PAS domain S-box protein [Pokkaliibacter sp. CJK22405]|uniref:PAS domain-containing hybrid sensor histidine kinase/response regulator n=1 Tax=Pokkaliibacter sp. CJK22405 TaxID=3384615 RepID=UPI003984F240
MKLKPLNSDYLNRTVLITLQACLLITVIVALTIRHINDLRTNDAVKEKGDIAFHAVIDRLHLYEHGLESTRAAVLAGGVEYMTREDFNRYGHTINLAEDFPGTRSFVFVRRVRDPDLDAFVERTRKLDWPQFELKDLNAHDHDEHFIVQYVTPEEDNTEAIGLDIATEASRRYAAIQAMVSGDTRITRPIQLISSDTGFRHSFLMLMPIYKGGEIPSTTEDRLNKAIGWAMAPITISDALTEQRLDPERFILTISDVTDTSYPEEFFINSKEKGSHTDIERFEVYGRIWRMTLSATPAFIDSLHLFSPLVAGLIGIFISLLASALVSVLLANYRNNQRLQMEQTRLTSIMESSADGIIGKTLEGKIIAWNAGAEHIFGFTREEAIGRYIVDLLIPDRLRHEEAIVLKRISNRETITSFETTRKRKDGREIPVSVSVAPIISATGQVIGASKSVRDISKQKAAESRIRDLNANLEKEVEQRTAELADLNLLMSNVLSAASEFSIIATDKSGVIRVFNRGAEILLGYSPEEIVGKTTPKIFHVRDEVEARAAELSAEIGREVNGFEVFTYNPISTGAEYREWTFIRKDGSQVPVTLVVTAMRDDAGDIIGFLGISTDITESKRAAADLNAAQEKLMATSDTLLMASKTAELGIWTWHLEDQHLEWNDKMYELYQQPISLAEGGLSFHHWSSRLHPDDVDMAIERLHQAIRGESEYDPTFRLVLDNGDIRYIQAGAYVEHDADGKPVKVTGINRDVTDDRELKQRLIKAKEIADAANEAKSLFLANMSHEIRTPMNAVLGMLELLLKTSLEDRQFGYANKAKMAATSLLSLLNDILDYSKIDAGKLELDPHSFDINALMEHLGVVMSGNLRGKSIELLFDMDEQLPQFLIGDQLRLQQVLINLSSNAIKFTSEGEVTVRITCQNIENGIAEIDFSIIDTGIGISPDQQERIFEGFTQAEASTTRRYGGTGLGLVISKRLIELMGGELKLDSHVGRGSHFHFTLRLPLDTSREWHSPHLTLAQPPRILVVDYHRASRELLARQLNHINGFVLTAQTAEQALQHMSQCGPMNTLCFDLILLDWPMPDTDMPALVRQLKNSCTNPNMQLLLLCSATEMELPHASKDLPFDGVLSRPVTPLRLVQTLEAVLTHQPMPDVLTDIGHEEEATGEHHGPLAGLHLLLVEDNLFNQEVAYELLTQEGAKVDVAPGGLEGVNQVLERQRPYDLVLMDMQMPDIDGLEATRRIRADSRFTHLPIIAMTANVSPSDQERCLEAGMNAHLGKPLDMPRVIETILEYTRANDEDSSKVIPVNQENLAAADTKEQAQLATPEADEENTDESDIQVMSSEEAMVDLMRRFAGNEKLCRKVIVGLVPSLQPILNDLRRQFETQDWEGARASAHTMKGTAGTAGYMRLHHQLAQLEKRLRQEPVEARQFSTALVGRLQGQAEQEQQMLIALLKEEETATQATAEVPTQDLQAKMQAAAQYLQSGNLKALDIIEEIHRALSLRTEFDQTLASLMEAAENLEFDAAQSQLMDLMERL